ncbi:hypothetical protein P4661_25745 [Priestia megaterium]|uniref:hypothetical protein n=1 Tax=Priestia megaterium TaxID=1404 RepID=UPI002E1CA1F9|nr:hypothetical protein [Priestia megaterium]
MDNKYSCYVFLADAPAQKEILTVFCEVKGHTKEEAHEKVTKELQLHKKERSYTLKYVGLINFPEVDQDVIDRQDELFEKYDAVWILNCSYNQK